MPAECSAEGTCVVRAVGPSRPAPFAIAGRFHRGIAKRSDVQCPTQHAAQPFGELPSIRRTRSR